MRRSREGGVGPAGAGGDGIEEDQKSVEDEAEQRPRYQDLSIRYRNTKEIEDAEKDAEVESQKVEELEKQLKYASAKNREALQNELDQRKARYIALSHRARALRKAADEEVSPFEEFVSKAHNGAMHTVLQFMGQRGVQPLVSLNRQIRQYALEDIGEEGLWPEDLTPIRLSQLEAWHSRFPNARTLNIEIDIIYQDKDTGAYHFDSLVRILKLSRSVEYLKIFYSYQNVREELISLALHPVFDAFKELSNLRSLDVSGLADFLCGREVQPPVLNTIERLAEAILKLVKLEHLKCFIFEGDPSHLYQSFKLLKQKEPYFLKTLDLSGSNVIPSFLESFRGPGLAHLQSLNLDHIGGFPIQNIPDLFARLGTCCGRNLKQLNLDSFNEDDIHGWPGGDPFFNGERMEKCKQGASLMPNLEYLSMNEIFNPDVQVDFDDFLINIVALYFKNLKVFKFSDNGSIQNLSLVLPALLTSCTQLEVLHMTFKLETSAEVNQFALLLPNLRNLRRLDYFKINTSPAYSTKGLCALVDALTGLRKLEYIDFEFFKNNRGFFASTRERYFVMKSERTAPTKRALVQLREMQMRGVTLGLNLLEWLHDYELFFSREDQESRLFEEAQKGDFRKLKLEGGRRRKSPRRSRRRSKKSKKSKPRVI